MLFDLRGRGRRRTIKVIYLSLALLMGGGLVLTGIGSDASGGLLDAFVDDRQGGGSNIGQREEDAQKATVARPLDPAAWADLVRARFQRAGDGDNYQQASGTYTASGKAKLREASAAYDRYLDVARRPDPGIAALAVRMFSPVGLNAPDRAARAQEIITAARPSDRSFTQLAVLAYQAGQARKGDLAARRAVELAPADERRELRQQLAQLKASGGRPEAAGQAQGQPVPDPAPSR